MDPKLAYTNGQGNRIWRNFSFIDPQFFPQEPELVTDCGQCFRCRKKRGIELAARCVLHASLFNRNMFLTLTHDEQNPEYHNTFDYTEIQKFKKRLRKKYPQKYMGIFNVHEYGRKGKKHWHLIVFNHGFADATFRTTRNGNDVYDSETLKKLWGKGRVEIGSVTEASAMYQAQYMEKDFTHGYVTSNKKSHSKHSGIGRPYFLKHYSQILSLGYIPINGRRMPLPRYFEKIAHRHYSHFYDKQAFHDLYWAGKLDRKATYRPFTKEKPIKELADLWPQYELRKAEKIKELEIEWDNVISQYLTTEQQPDFYKSGSNALYDLNKKSRKEEF